MKELRCSLNVAFDQERIAFRLAYLPLNPLQTGESKHQEHQVDWAT